MYHELTNKAASRIRRSRIAVVVGIIVVALGVILVVGMARASAREQGAAALRESIIQAAEQCCAVEGSYPSSLSHLEEDYGLRINHTDYIITYESYAANVLPSVVVVPR